MSTPVRTANSGRATRAPKARAKTAKKRPQPTIEDRADIRAARRALADPGRVPLETALERLDRRRAS